MKSRDGTLSLDEANCQHEIRVTKKSRLQKYHRKCIGEDCKRSFTTDNKFIRICKNCKSTEVYRYYEESYER